MIHVIDIHGHKRTTIKKVGENLWEFDGRGIYMTQDCPNGEYFDSDIMVLTVPNSRIDGEGIKGMIRFWKKLIKEKPLYENELDYVPKWVRDPARIFITGSYDPEGYIGTGKDMREAPLYYIGFLAQNKYRKNYAPTFNDRSTPEEHEGCGIEVTEENLKKYIAELEKEIGEEVKIEEGEEEKTSKKQKLTDKLKFWKK